MSEVPLYTRSNNSYFIDGSVRTIAWTGTGTGRGPERASVALSLPLSLQEKEGTGEADALRSANAELQGRLEQALQTAALVEGHGEVDGLRVAHEELQALLDQTLDTASRKVLPTTSPQSTGVPRS